MNVLSGGTKQHLMSYKGASLKNGRPILVKSGGMSKSSCGRRYDSRVLNNAVQFNDSIKSYPDEICKKCQSRFVSLMGEAKKLKV